MGSSSQKRSTTASIAETADGSAENWRILCGAMMLPLGSLPLDTAVHAAMPYGPEQSRWFIKRLQETRPQH